MIIDKEVKNLLFTANFGIEKEAHRVDKNNKAAATPHPFDDRLIIKMDFAESQVEIATPVCKSAELVYNCLKKYNDIVIKEIAKKGERLWGNSNPPYFGSVDDIKIAQFPDDPEETRFREYLALKYGKHMLMFSGIHYNFSFSDELLIALFNSSDDNDFTRFKNRIYLKLAKYSFLYAWFFVCKFAASPNCHKSFEAGVPIDDDMVFTGFSSLRCSPFGYKNKRNLYLDFNSIKGYTNSMDELVDMGVIRHCCEYYAPVRIKAKKGNDMQALREFGADFIELRMIDLNPAEPVGISLDQINFVHRYLIFFLFLPDFELSAALQEQSYNKVFEASLYNRPEYMVREASQLERDVEGFFKSLNL